MEDRLAFLIGKIYLGQPYVAAEGNVGQGTIAVGMLPCPLARVLFGLGDVAVHVDLGIDKGNVALVGLGQGVHQREDTLGTRHCHDDGVDLLGDLIDVARELARHGQEGNNDADVKGIGAEQTLDADIGRVRKQENTANHGNDDIHDVTDIHNDGAQGVGVRVSAEVVLKECLIDFSKVGFALLFVAEHFDNLLTVHHFLNEALLLTHRVLQAKEVFCRAAADLLGHKEHEDDADHEKHRQPHAVPQHDTKDAGDDDHGTDECGKCLRYKLTEGIDVIGVVGHDIAVLVGVKILNGKVLHALEHGAAHLVKEALRDVRHELGFHGDGNDGDHIEAKQDHDLRKDLGFCRLPKCRARHGACLPHVLPYADQLDDLLQDDGGDGGGNGDKDGAGDGKGNENRVVAEEHGYQALHHAAVEFFLGRLIDGFIHGCHLRLFAVRRLRDRYRLWQAVRRACPRRRSCRCPSQGSDRHPPPRTHAVR